MKFKLNKILFFYCVTILFIYLPGKSYSDTIPIWDIRYNDSIIIQSNLTEFYESDLYQPYSSFTKEEVEELLKDTTIWHWGADSLILFNYDFLFDTTTEYFKYCKKDNIINDSISKSIKHSYNLDKVTARIHCKNNGKLTILFRKDQDLVDINDKILFESPATREIEIQDDTGSILYRIKNQYNQNEKADYGIIIKISNVLSILKRASISSFVIYYSEYCRDCINEKIVLGKIIIE